jgi:hypothetical protein
MDQFPQMFVCDTPGHTKTNPPPPGVPESTPPPLRHLLRRFSSTPPGVPESTVELSHISGITTCRALMQFLRSFFEIFFTTYSAGFEPINSC